MEAYYDQGAPAPLEDIKSESAFAGYCVDRDDADHVYAGMLSTFLMPDRQGRTAVYQAVGVNTEANPSTVINASQEDINYYHKTMRKQIWDRRYPIDQYYKRNVGYRAVVEDSNPFTGSLISDDYGFLGSDFKNAVLLLRLRVRTYVDPQNREMMVARWDCTAALCSNGFGSFVKKGEPIGFCYLPAKRI